MINKNHEVYKHKHICLVEEHQNPLGIVRKSPLARMAVPI